MGKMKGHSILALVLILFTNVHRSSQLDVFAVFKLTKFVTVELFHAWERLSPESHEHPLPPFLRHDDAKILNKIGNLQERLDVIDTEVKMQAAGIVETLKTNLPNVVRNELRISHLLQLLSEIDRKDKLLKVYTSAGMNGTRTDSLWKFSESIISQDYNSVLSIWDRLHSTFMAPEYLGATGAIPQSSILHQMAETIEEYEENICNIQQSPMQLLYNLYNSLQLSQLKAYTLMQFSWLYRNTKNESLNYDDEAKAMKDLYLSRLSKQAEVAKNAMSKVSQALWRCDPREHVEDETFTSLSYFLQGFLLNEVDMNTDGTCREDCPFYKYTKQHGCYKDNYCVKQPICKGDIVNCRFVDSDMWVCPSDYNKSKRRYEWIKYENGRVLGEAADGTCRKRLDKVDSWWRWLFWHCSYCFCICDETENTKSDRYFSLEPTQSDVKNNRVLTGIKFVKLNQVIYIEGQEGELRPNGEINSTTISWIPIKEVNPRSNDYIEGLEYYKASFHQRQVDLDDLMAPPDHVLTGVKWRKVGHHLNFEIKVCRWNFTTGQLLQNGLNCQWISNDNTDASEKPRQKIYLNAPDVPTKIRVQSRVDSKTDQFVEFTHTDLGADVAQSAVPFIDTQAVIPEPAVPLIGAGIYHKGMYKSGGYIAPKVFTMDYTKHMQTDFDAV